MVLQSGRVGRMKNLKSIFTNLTGPTVWYSPTTLCLTALYYLGSLIFILAFGLILCVLPVLYTGWKLAEVSRYWQKGTSLEKKEQRS